MQLWLAFLLVSVLAGFGFTVYQFQRVNHFRQVDGELETRVAALSRAVREAGFTRGPRPGGPPDPRPSGPPPLDPPPSAIPRSDLPISADTAALFSSGGYYYIVWRRDDRLLKQSAGAPPDSPPPQNFERDTLVHWRTREPFREAFHCSGLGDCALAGRSIEADLAATRNFAWALVAAGGAVLAVGLGIGWWLTTRAIRPIEQISAAASRISHGNLSERIAVADRGNELGQLAGILNSTFARLEAAFARQRQFTADAAHELRTPLAVIISETQTTLTRERTASEYREALEGCLDTAQQMRRLTESLLELARFDAAGGAAASSEIDLAETARCSVEKIRRLADLRGVRIHCHLAPARTRSVSDRLGQVITNLLSNAIEYNRTDGEVRIATSAAADAAILTVSDTGVGISGADLPHIFERFYRADRSRSRAEGHAGLGLAICRAIVDAEGGNIQVVSTVNSGTTFTVRLPASHK